jgi:hypothetical protein
VITFSLQHGRTGAVARQRLATTVDEVRRRGGALVQHVTWSADHTQVRLGGVLGGDAGRCPGGTWRGGSGRPGGLLGGPLVQPITQLVQHAFQRQLP